MRYKLLVSSSVILVLLSVGCKTQNPEVLSPAVSKIETPKPEDPPCSVKAEKDVSVSDVKKVFGISLGFPLSIPECPKTRYGSRVEYVFSKETCWRRFSNTESCDALQDESFIVEFPFLSLPSWVKDSSITGRSVSGRVELISIETDGVSGQDSALNSLVEKYGKPAVLLNDTVQNRLGAQYGSISASWEVDGINVIFLGIVGSLDEGKVEVSTDIGKSAQNKINEEYMKSKKSL